MQVLRGGCSEKYDIPVKREEAYHVLCTKFQIIHKAVVIKRG